MEAGLYDRADLSLELLEKTSFADQSLQLRLSLAQRLSNLSQAIMFAEKLEKKDNISLQHIKIHFLCEMAEQGDKFAKEKAKELGCDHPRVLALDSKSLQSNFSKKSFVCNVRDAKFSDHFWRCHVCNTWDSAN